MTIWKKLGYAALSVAMSLAIIVFLFMVGTLATAQEVKRVNHKIKVAVIDTGLNLLDPRFKNVLCSSGHQDFTGTGIIDRNGHGTHVAGLIAHHAGDADYCMVILKYYLESATGSVNLIREMRAFKKAIDLGVDVINFSGGGQEANQSELKMIRDEARDITFIVAAGNEDEDISVSANAYFPASYILPNVLVVGSTNGFGMKSKTSNYGSRINAWEVGESVESTFPGGNMGILSGTSQATAIHTGKMIREMSTKPTRRSPTGPR